MNLPFGESSEPDLVAVLILSNMIKVFNLPKSFSKAM